MTAHDAGRGMDLNQKLLTAFQIEHVEHLEAIRTMLARLEQSGLTDGSALAEAFRWPTASRGRPGSPA